MGDPTINNKDYSIEGLHLGHLLRDMTMHAVALHSPSLQGGCSEIAHRDEYGTANGDSRALTRSMIFHGLPDATVT